jgi:hypothetical protein
MLQILSDQMLNLLDQPQFKEAGLVMELVLKDGSKRNGVYMDIVVNPLNNTMHKGERFIKFRTNTPERDLLIYLPIKEIATIEWST